MDLQNDDILVIPDDAFLSSDNFYEIFDIFFLSYQPGIAIQKKISPIIRTGTISLMNQDNTFYVDAAVFPGNSGSPVFINPSAIRSGEKGFTIGRDTLGGKFIGIIGEYLPYQEVAVSNQTGRPRVVFEENTGLSRVWSVSFIHDIIESKDFKDQLDRIKEEIKKEEQTS